MDRILESLFSDVVRDQAFAVDSILELLGAVPKDQIPRIFSALVEGAVKLSQDSFKTLVFLVTKNCDYLDFRYYLIQSILQRLNQDLGESSGFEKLFTILFCIKWENTPEKLLLAEDGDIKMKYGSLICDLWASMLTNAPPSYQLRVVNFVCKKVLPFVKIPNLIPLIFHLLINSVPNFQTMESIFKLIINENVEFRSFYAQLSRITTFEAFSEKQNEVNMRLFSTFLSSDKLPSSYAAHFIKKLLLLSIFSSSEVVQFSLAMLEDMIENTPSLKVMIQREGLPFEESFIGDELGAGSIPPLYELKIVEKILYAYSLKLPNFTCSNKNSTAVSLFFDFLENSGQHHLLLDELKRTVRSCPLSGDIPLTLI